MALALDIKKVRKIYGNGVEALKGVDLQVEEGDFYALLGPNGAGKTTLIGIVSGLVTKSDGVVTVSGYDADRELEKAKSSLGLVPQEFNFNIFEKVEDIVVNQAGYYGVPRDQALAETEKLLKQLGLWEKRWDASRMLSGGMKRRLMIARALVHRPKVLILDEPTAGVDVELRRSMWDFLRELNASGVTIILTTHYLEEAEQLCRNMAIINKGEIVEQGSIKSLLGKMQRETFVVDVFGTIDKSIEETLKDFVGHVVDENTLEVSVENGQTLHDAVLLLDRQGVKVRSMRNKANRLEEFFVHLTKDTDSQH
jgi:ABC-2 type transport system ATP-binding protein